MVAELERLEAVEVVEEKRMEGERIQRDRYVGLRFLEVLLWLWLLGSESSLMGCDGDGEGAKSRGRRINRDVTCD